MLYGGVDRPHQEGEEAEVAHCPLHPLLWLAGAVAQGIQHPARDPDPAGRRAHPGPAQTRGGQQEEELKSEN